jgi:hypothetical protein
MTGCPEAESFAFQVISPKLTASSTSSQSGARCLISFCVLRTIAGRKP